MASDFGPCDKCGQNNSHHATMCHTWGAVLPWAKTKPVKTQAQITPPPRTARVGVTRKQVSSSSIEWGLWVWAR